MIWIRLLPVVVILALPPAIQSPGRSYVMAAVKAISTVHTAETQYYSQFGQYPTTLAQLGPPTSGTHTYFSDQSMTIHQHTGQEPATASDPLLGAQ